MTEGSVHLAAKPLRRLSYATRGADGRFASAWAEVAPDLERLLHDLGCHPETVQDLCQEVAILVIRKRVQYNGATDLLPWCRSVARSLALRERRRDARRRTIEARVFSHPDDGIAVDAACIRTSAVEIWSELTRTDRLALVGAVVTSADDGTARSTSYVRLHRARARLQRLARGVLAIAVALSGHAVAFGADSCVQIVA